MRTGAGPSVAARRAPLGSDARPRGAPSSPTTSGRSAHDVLDAAPRHRREGHEEATSTVGARVGGGRRGAQIVGERASNGGTKRGERTAGAAKPPHGVRPRARVASRVGWSTSSTAPHAANRAPVLAHSQATRLRRARRRAHVLRVAALGARRRARPPPPGSSPPPPRESRRTRRSRQRTVDHSAASGGARSSTPRGGRAAREAHGGRQRGRHLVGLDASASAAPAPCLPTASLGGGAAHTAACGARTASTWTSSARGPREARRARAVAAFGGSSTTATSRRAAAPHRRWRARAAPSLARPRRASARGRGAGRGRARRARAQRAG